MNRKTKHWLRLVYPPWWVFALFFAAYAIIGMLAWWIGHYFGDAQIAATVTTMQSQIVVACAGLYGAFRSLFFHPAANPDYAAWLRATPWTYRLPLPRGPVWLVSQDALLLAVMTLLAIGSPSVMILVPICFLAFYLVFTTVLVGLTGVRSIAYLLAAVLGLAVCLHETPVGAACLLAVLYLPAWWGLRESLKRFSWPLVEAARRRENTIPVGWPYSQLSPKESEIPIGPLDRVALSLLVGWWFYVIFSLASPGDRGDFAIAICILVPPVAAGWRTATYWINHRPPISLWGRLWTGRWIIPGYDKIFVAPLCVMAVLAATLPLLPRFGNPNLAWCAVSISSSLLIVLRMGPSYRSWTLTGEHRLTASNLNTDRTKLARR